MKPHRTLLSALVLVALGGTSACLDLPRTEADAALDVVVPESVGSDTAGPGDIAPGDAPVGDGTANCVCLPADDDPCVEQKCTGPGCSDQLAADGTSCTEGCEPRSCVAGQCQLSGASAPTGGECWNSTHCTDTACQTYGCNLSTCECVATAKVGTAGCCAEDSDCASSTAEGCVSYTCNTATSTCELDVDYDASECTCTVDDDCNDVYLGCKTLKCSDSACSVETPSCVSCTSDTDCEAALPIGPCEVASCQAGTCAVDSIAGCTLCTSTVDCPAPTNACSKVLCLGGRCEEGEDLGCQACSIDKTGCASVPNYPCYTASCAVDVGQCEYKFGGIGCDGPDTCATAEDCSGAGKPCAVASCDTGICSYLAVPGCAEQACNPEGAVSPLEALASSPGTIVKVQAPWVPGAIESVDLCGLQPTSGNGPLRLGNPAVGIDVNATALPTSPPWDCVWTCGEADCTPLLDEVEYWVWGKIVADATGTNRLQAAGWCHVMTQPNLVGSYMLQFQGTPLIAPVQMVVSSDGAFTFPHEDWIGASATFSGGELILSIVTGGGTPVGLIVFEGEGNQLVGIAEFDGAYNVIGTRL